MIGGNALVTHHYDRDVNVSAYDPQHGSRTVKIVGGAYAYDDPTSGEVIVLVVNQGLYVPTSPHSLLCPAQMRMNEVRIDECPKSMHSSPTDNTHTVRAHFDDPEKTAGTHDNEYRIPLLLAGITSYMPVRTPSEHEYQTCRKINLTFDLPEWNPHDIVYARAEEAMLTPTGECVDSGDRDQDKRQVIKSLNLDLDSTHAQSDQHSQCCAVLAEISNTLNPDTFAQDLSDTCNISLITSAKKGEGINEAQLARNWGIGVEKAKKTLSVTTQRGVRTVANPLISRRYRTNDRQLRYRRLATDLYTDTMFAGTKSKRGNSAAQVFGTDFKWSRAHAIVNKGEAHEALSTVFTRDGVPNALIMDNSKEQTLGQFRKKAREAGCGIRTTEPYSAWSNRAEGTIRDLKQGSGRKMVKTCSPKRLWDDCLELEAMIQSHSYHNIYKLNGEVPETVMTGQTADISQFAEHGWYDWIMFRDTAVSFPEDKWVLGKYLGPSFDVGPAMCAKLLKANGNYAHRSTYRSLTRDEMEDPQVLESMREFKASVHAALGPNAAPGDFDDIDIDIDTPAFAPYEDDEQEAQVPLEADDPDHFENLDEFLHAQVNLPIGGTMRSGTVVGRKRSVDGTLIGKRHANPILDTREYTVEFPDGAHAEYAANVIAENMYSQCDIDGNQYLLLATIVDHRTNGHAVAKADGMINVKGKQCRRKTTKGWELCCEWRDGSTSWEPLSRLKESNPVNVAEYAVSRNIQDEPAFAWWVAYTLKKRNRIIAAVNARYRKRTHKFGVEVPNNVAEALALDAKNGNDYWQAAIDKEMKAVRIAFKVLEQDDKIPVGYSAMSGHLIYDVKMENFRRKVRYVADGHKTQTPESMTYASVVSRETVRIALTLAALNDLQVKTSDIENAYLTAPVTEKLYIICGPEFGPDAGKRALIVRALYGLKSAGNSFRNHLADCMVTLGYESCRADQDLWYKAEIRPSDGHQYYSYVLLYVDDALVIHHDAEAALNKLDWFFKMKAGSIGDPDIYLGAKLKRTHLPNGVEAWALSPSKYVREAVSTCKDYLAANYDGRTLAKRAPTPFARDYRPELDTTPELGAEEGSFYQSQIGVLRWMVELGRVDIITEVSLLSSHLALPREGHLEAVFRIFAYLNCKHNSRMIFDPTYPEIDMRAFKECDWKHFYGSIKEAIPPNMPTPRGKEVDLRLFVDSDHAGDQIARRSRTGYFIYLNMAPVAWFSKKQGTIETSVFGAEFVAMKVGMEALRGLRYKLRMMGVPLSGPSYIYGDNMSVIHNTQRPESTLKKKSNSICYHAIRESVAMGESLTGHIPTAENPADLCTKVLPGGAKRDHLIGKVLYDITDEH